MMDRAIGRVEAGEVGEEVDLSGLDDLPTDGE